MYPNKSSWTPKNLFKRGQKGLWWQFAKTTGLYQDSTVTTPVNGAAQPVGFFPDLTTNAINGTQATSAARPTYQISPSRVTLDRVDDTISFTVPTGGIIGTMIYATTLGTLAHGVSIPAGTYTVGGLYAPVLDIVGIIIREGEMSCAEIERCYTYFKSIGGGPAGISAYRSQTNISNIFRGTVSGNIFAKVTNFPVFATSSTTNFVSAFRGMTSLTSFPSINTSSATSFSGMCDGNTSLTSFPLLTTTSVTSCSTAWNGCTNLATFPANMFDATGCTNFSSAFTGCALTQTSVDNILVSIDTAGTSNGTLNLTGGTNSTPSATGLTAKTNLQGRGWTVTNN